LNRQLSLAVESSGPRSSVAVLDGEELLAECEFARGSGGRGSGSPAAAADEALRTAGAAPGDLSLVAASIGPGSYTGLRVGVSFAKCFAWARSIETVAVPSMWALAEEALATAGRPRPALLLATADAFRKQVYLRCFSADDDRRSEPLTDDAVLPPEDAASFVKSSLPSSALEGCALVFGSGMSRYETPLRAALGELLTSARFETSPVCPSAAAVGRIGLRLHRAGKALLPHDLAPLYLRKTEAEERLESGHRR